MVAQLGRSPLPPIFSEEVSLRSQMDRTAHGCQPDQQGGLQVPAAEPDQSLMSEFDSVLEEAGRASPNSAAADSADRSADQDLSSDEYSELTQDLTLQNIS